MWLTSQTKCGKTKGDTQSQSIFWGYVLKLELKISGTAWNHLNFHWDPPSRSVTLSHADFPISTIFQYCFKLSSRSVTVIPKPFFPVFSDFGGFQIHGCMFGATKSNWNHHSCTFWPIRPIRKSHSYMLGLLRLIGLLLIKNHLRIGSHTSRSHQVPQSILFGTLLL